MALCKLCLQEIKNGVPVPGYKEASDMIREECLAAAALKVAQDPKKEGLLRYLLDYEKSTRPMIGQRMSLFIMEIKYKRQRRLKLDLAVFAAGNTDKAIAPELMSRFGGGVLYLKPYSKEEFLNVCQSYLSRYGGVPMDIGSLIAEQTWH
jgi:hypothetical protein